MEHFYKPNNCTLTSSNITRLKTEVKKTIKDKITTVGASVLTSEGNIFNGHFIKGSTCYTSIHAEMAAVSNAICSESSKIIAIAIYFVTKNSIMNQFPCGTCLQLLMENKTDKELWVIIGSINKPEWEWYPLSKLYPYPWTNS